MSFFRRNIQAAIAGAMLLTAGAGVARAQQVQFTEPTADQQGQVQEFQQQPAMPEAYAGPAEAAPNEAAPGYPGPNGYPPYGEGPSQDATYGTSLIPPNAEGTPYPAEAGGYCYVGPHPVDTRIMPGPAWDETQGQHLRPYPPIDTRLFAYHDGCYYFTGDPRDFGYGGQTYAYYGAHPILDIYGGGWCFMMGGHTHLWAPWSPYFTVVGSWYYWHGPYDPFFWAYWPYYSFYYRSYYPNYYGGGRFYRGGGYRVAPPIRAVPAPYGRSAAPVRGMPPTQMYRGSPATAPARGTPAPQMYRGSPPTAPTRSVPAPAARPSFSPPARTFAPSHSGGFGNRVGGGFRGGGGRR